MTVGITDSIVKRRGVGRSTIKLMCISPEQIKESEQRMEKALYESHNASQKVITNHIADQNKKISALNDIMKEVRNALHEIAKRL